LFVVNTKQQIASIVNKTKESSEEISLIQNIKEIKTTKHAMYTINKETSSYLMP
jgi:hypothetical protein